MKKSFFILIPADTPDGPVKGAYALANSMSQRRDVTLVFVKHGRGANAPLHPAVKKVCLADRASGYFNKLRLYRSLLAASGNREEVVSISLCFSADAINVACRAQALTCSSVRGNLPENYRMDYGLAGILLARTHLLGLRFFDHVIAMTKPMAEQISAYIGRMPSVIGNFIDEGVLLSERTEKQSTNSMRFIFIGSLSSRKRPLLLLEAFRKILQLGHQAQLDFVGEGPLKEELEYQIKQKNLTFHVRTHGFQEFPHKMLQKADVLVLPSLSEGTSRAVLEALFLGTPCVVSNIDGNGELITEDQNGALFSDASNLPDAMLRAVHLSRRIGATRLILTPPQCRQSLAVNSYLTMLEADAQ